MEHEKNGSEGEAEQMNGMEDVIPVYANNVRFEITAWDLRVLFGQLMPRSEGRGQIDWHTDVTIPWSQAKLMHLYLGINLAIYERENGRIKVPHRVLPTPPSAPPDSVDPSNSDAIETLTMVQGMVKAFREAQLQRD